MAGLTPAQFQALGPAPAATATVPQSSTPTGGLSPTQFAALKPPVVNSGGIDVSNRPFNPLNQNSQAVDTRKPAASPGTGAFFLGSIGSGVKQTAGNLIDPIKGGAKEVSTDTSQAFTGGLQQGREGAAQIAKGGSPLNLIEGVGKIGAGFVQSAFSPFAAPLKPVTNAVNYTADKISNSPTIQKFSNTTLGKVMAQGAGDVANYSAIAGTVGGLMDTPHITAAGATKLDTAIEPLKPGAMQTYADAIDTTNKTAKVVGNLPDKAAEAVQNHYIKQVADTWTKPAEAPKGFMKAQDIFNTATDKGHNIAQTLAESKINPSDNIEKGIYTTTDTADRMHADANKMSNQMLRPSLEKADLTTPKTPVSEVIDSAKTNIKNNPKLTQEMKDSLTAKLGDTADSLNKQHPDGMSLTNLHDEKIVRDTNAKYSPVGDIATNAEAIKNKAVADAARKLVETKAPPEVPVEHFNAELTKMHEAANYLEALNGKKAPTGAFSKLANYGGKLAGLAVGHSVGHGILADVAGYHIGGIVERMFEGMSNPVKDHFLENLKTTNPEAFDKISTYLKSPGPTAEEVAAARTPANPENLVSAGGTGGAVKEIPNKYGPYDIVKNRNTTMGSKLPPGTRLFSDFEKNFTPEQITQANRMVEALQNQGKTIDMKAVNQIVKKITPVEDVKPIAKPMVNAQDAARLNRIQKIPVKRGAFSRKP